jgi:hypothetical protein
VGTQPRGVGRARRREDNDSERKPGNDDVALPEVVARRDVLLRWGVHVCFQGIYMSRIDAKHMCETGIRVLAPYKNSRTRPCFDVAGSLPAGACGCIVSTCHSMYGHIRNADEEKKVHRHADGGALFSGWHHYLAYYTLIVALCVVPLVVAPRPPFSRRVLVVFGSASALDRKNSDGDAL